MDRRAADLGAGDPAEAGRPSAPETDQHLYKPGETCGPYRIDAFLDAGGFAEVYAATNVLTDQRAALKVLQSVRGRSKEAVRRFQREIKLLAAIKHVNVVACYEAGRENGRLWVAMELLEGRSLRTYLLDRGPLEAAEALRILFEMSCGVAAAQELQVVHRDLKPENVWITQLDVAKVLDFGIAKLEGWGFSSTGPALRPMLGTPSYMTPEQIAGKSPKFASDVYQLGIIAYEMLAGRHAWSYENGEFPTQAQITEQQARHAPQPLAELGVREDVAALIERAMAKDPADRFPTAAALAAATWKLLAAIRSERGAQKRRDDQRNPEGPDGEAMGPGARRAYEPAQTPAQMVTAPALPEKKVELGPTVAPIRTVPLPEVRERRAAPAVHTLPLDADAPAAEASAQQWQGRPTAPMPAPNLAPRDHAPAWLGAGKKEAGAVVAARRAPREVVRSSLAGVGGSRETVRLPGAAQRAAQRWTAGLVVVSVAAVLVLGGYAVLRRGRGEGAAAVVVTATASASATGPAPEISSAKAMVTPSATGSAMPSAVAAATASVTAAATPSATATATATGTAAKVAPRGPRKEPPAARPAGSGVWGYE
jgi:serine/threonine-protein kinase